ncbi:ribbon-helix-helix CopG family protein [Actinorugispora endophytica]|uniref:Ribbon-helix-helix CopG family protein n=2 Tax=Actinorugispora endophytica TaxID=1605990 RepID=A0A4R6UVR7_9ACTN|nr:ribbon-helix-helix CopG family protein [Actinorugispora endophytica]
MTLRLTDDETEALRRQAENEGRSMQQVVRAALEEYLARHGDDEFTLELAREEAARFSEVLRRLGE